MTGTCDQRSVASTYAPRAETEGQEQGPGPGLEPGQGQGQWQQPETKSEPGTGAGPQAEAKADTEAVPEVATGIEAEAGSEAETGTEGETEAGAEGEVGNEGEAEAGVGVAVKADLETEADADAEPGTEVRSETEVKADAEGETGAAGEAETEAKTEVEPKTETDPNTEVEWYQQPLLTDPEATADPTLAPPPLTPAQAFDALYAYCAPTLVRQTYLLTGRRRSARDAVERAFQVAWQRWPEVAVDPDPAGWVRAVAHDCALSPWNRLRPRLPAPFRRREPAPADPTGRALLAVLRKLPPPYRRAVVLYDGVGLDLPETAAESEASTPATAGRLLYARATVMARLPEPVTPDALHRLLNELPADVHPRPTKPIVLRVRADLRARRWVHAAIAFTALLLTSTALTLRTAPDHYEAPVHPGAPVRGVPPKAAPGPLSEEQLILRARLRSAAAAGPEKLRPEAR